MARSFFHQVRQVMEEKSSKSTGSCDLRIGSCHRQSVFASLLGTKSSPRQSKRTEVRLGAKDKQKRLGTLETRLFKMLQALLLEQLRLAQAFGSNDLELRWCELPCFLAWQGNGQPGVSLLQSCSGGLNPKRNICLSGPEPAKRNDLFC